MFAQWLSRQPHAARQESRGAGLSPTRGPAVCFLLLRANKGKIYFSLTFFKVLIEISFLMF